MMTPDSLQRAQLYIKHAEERLKETKKTAGAGQTGLVGGVIKDYQEEMDRVKKEIQIAKQSKKDVIPVLEAITESTPKHSAILKNVAIGAPALAEKIKPALNVSEESREQAIEELENITGTSYQE
jgi:Ni,Fe-hydrogenase III small subunit